MRPRMTKHQGYAGSICAECKATANVPWDTVWWQCARCSFFNKLLTRLKTFELPDVGLTLNQVAKEMMEELS